MPYEHLKNSFYIAKAREFKKQYGLFKIDGLDGKWGVAKISYSNENENEIDVMYMSKEEIESGEPNIMALVGNYFKIIDNMLSPIDDDRVKFLSGQKNFVRLISNELNLDLKVGKSAKILASGEEYITPEPKVEELPQVSRGWYIVPADIIESNFPDDMPALMERSVLVTEEVILGMVSALKTLNNVN